MKHSLLLALLLTPTLSAWAQPVPSATPVVGKTPSETELVLTPRIKIALSEKVQMLRGANINVDSDVSTRTVVLRGLVASQAQKALVGQIASQNAGSFRVRNLLVVRSDGTKSQEKVPAGLQQAFHFLEILAIAQGRLPNTNKAVFSDADVSSLLQFVSRKGVQLRDNEEMSGQILSRTQLQRELKRHGSVAFYWFSSAGYFFNSLGSSSLVFQQKHGTATIQVFDKYLFLWKRERGQLRLQRVEFHP